jgi:hypothetical protein
MTLVVKRIAAPFGAETVHRATKYDVFKYKRDLRRTTINEYSPEIASTDAKNQAAPSPARRPSTSPKPRHARHCARKVSFPTM